MNFNILNYHCEYAVKEGGVETISRLDKNKHVCFSTFFHAHGNGYKHESLEIKVRIYHTITKHSQSVDNYCTLSEEELKEWLDYLSNIVCFDYEIIREGESYLVVLKIVDNHGAVKFLLTALRSCYEAVFSLILKEAFSLFKLRVFPELTLFNYFILVSSAVNYWNSGHSILNIDTSYQLLSDKELFMIGQTAEKDGQICHLFKTTNPQLKFVKVPKNDNRNWCLKNGELDFSEESVLARVEKYHLPNYNLYKK